MLSESLPVNVCCAVAGITLTHTMNAKAAKSAKKTAGKFVLCGLCVPRLPYCFNADTPLLGCAEFLQQGHGARVGQLDRRLEAERIGASRGSGSPSAGG